MPNALTRFDWLVALNEELAKSSLRFGMRLHFAEDFVLVEADWSVGGTPAEVCARIVAGTHPHVRLSSAELAANTVTNG